MNIGIDARMLGPECGGLGRYVEQLVRHLLEIDSSNHYVLFLKKNNIESVPSPLPAIAHAPNVTKILADVHWYGWKEQTEFLKIIKSANVDLMHFPHWNVPLLYNKPFVVTIHDLLLLHYPTREASTLGPVAYAVKQAAYKKVLSHAAGAAKHIFAPSEFTKADIMDKLGVLAEKISVTYEAPFFAESFGLGASAVVSESNSILKKHKITKPYALYIGVAYPHKNLSGLLRAWKLVEEEYEENINTAENKCPPEQSFAVAGAPQLVLAGKRNFFYEQLLGSDEFRACKRVVYTDFVTDAELAELYKNARAYVFPSLYEGFGLPGLEAMHYGVPVVSSNRTCLPEIFGEAALYADPENPGQFAEQIITAFENEDVRFTLRQKSAEELKKYSWKKMAEQTLAVYQDYA